MLDLVRITVTKTADGQREYMQILTADALSVNVVLVADRIEIQDCREAAKAEGK